MFCLGIIYGDDGILQNTVGGHASQADDPCGGLFRPSPDALEQLRSIGMYSGNQIGPVIHGIVRLGIQNRIDMLVIGFMIFTLDGKNGYPVMFHEGRRNIILRA